METTNFLASSTRWCISEGQHKIYHNLWLSLFNENKNKYLRVPLLQVTLDSALDLTDEFPLLNITTRSTLCCKIFAEIGVFIKYNKD